MAHQDYAVGNDDLEGLYGDLEGIFDVLLLQFPRACRVIGLLYKVFNLSVKSRHGFIQQHQQEQTRVDEQRTA